MRGDCWQREVGAILGVWRGLRAMMVILAADPPLCFAAA